MGEQDTSAWIAQARAGGQTPEQIYLALLGQGWSVAAIQDAYHQADRAEHAGDLRQRVVRIVVGVGAVLIGAGVFSFVAANWQYISDWGRIGLIVTGMLAASVTGWALREYRDYRFTGGALLLLGSIIFGAGIFLVAQIFNLQGNWPDGFVMWSMGTLAMAMATRLRVLYVLGLLVGLIALAGYPFGLADPYALDAFLLTPAWLVLAGAAFALLAARVLDADMPAGAKDRW